MAESVQRTFRLPNSTYILVVFVAFGATALQFAPAFLLLYLVPALGVVFIRRVRTMVDASGITVQALLGREVMPWSTIRGLSVNDRNVYAVTVDGSVRLPCVRIVDLTAIAAASGGALPDLPEPPVKGAPERRRR